MGKLKDLEIRYTSNPVYAGHFLRGHVCFNVKEPTKLKDVSLWVEGQTKVTLPGETTDEKWLLRTEVNLYRYLSQFDYRLPPGFHQIPFAFPVPQFLPSSFGEKHGYIYYCCRLTINGRSKTYKAFTVIGIEDLNWHPYAALPINIKERAAAPFWSIFNRNAYNLSVVLQLERTGFVPGEAIVINAEIINQSNRKVKQSVMELKQGILYKTPNGHEREIVKIIETVKRDGIPPCNVDQWENEALTIPPIPPSFLRGSEYVSVKYELIFTVDPGISLTIPVIIGTVPYVPESLNRVAKALPWKDPMHCPIYANGNGIGNGVGNGIKPKQKIYMDEDEGDYVRNMKYGSANERGCIKIEEVD